MIREADTPSEASVTRDSEERLKERLAWADMGVGDERGYGVKDQDDLGRIFDADPDLDNEVRAEQAADREIALEFQQTRREAERQHKALMRDPAVVETL